MRSLPLIARLVMAAAGALAPCLLVVSVVDTSPLRPASGHSARPARLVCDQRVPPRRALARMARIAFPAATRRTVLRDVSALLQRNRTKAFSDDDDNAIQNDPSAVRVEEGGQTPTALEPAGVLVPPHSPLRSHRTLSRRSPRGPPAFS